MPEVSCHTRRATLGERCILNQHSHFKNQNTDKMTGATRITMRGHSIAQMRGDPKRWRYGFSHLPSTFIIHERCLPAGETRRS